MEEEEDVHGRGNYPRAAAGLSTAVNNDAELIASITWLFAAAPHDGVPQLQSAVVTLAPAHMMQTGWARNMLDDLNLEWIGRAILYAKLFAAVPLLAVAFMYLFTFCPRRLVGYYRRTGPAGRVGRSVRVVLECYLVVAGLAGLVPTREWRHRWGSSCQNLAMADRANRSLTSRPGQPGPARLERMGRNADQKGRRNKRHRRESTKSKTGGCGAHISSRGQQTRKRSIRPPCGGKQKHTAGRLLECTEQIDLMRIDRNQKRQQEEEEAKEEVAVDVGGEEEEIAQWRSRQIDVSLLEENSRKIGNNQKSRDKKKGQQSNAIKVKSRGRDIQE
ncbi:hypothetical protein DAPPUDRAFT_108949 [Daphnia pulex]|uniref:Uncharacterized protein n=1 Tax=Daphnia pulex TaxID=6669 RepID=E9H1B2_DAPPU|nr:hypothetical protein DAPPUDRAFT_108949 [Daphnia pulex]|eukprot:EFX74450.1 hypothetical protein DAPPUDRAFT_108949 [Daphnia pulex]